MTDPKNLAEGAGHTTPSLPPPKERGVPRLELAKGESGTLRVAIGGDWSNIGRAAGAPEVSHWIAMQLAAMGEHGFPVSETATNCALTFVSEMKPRDPAELLRLTQMAAIHQATLTMARRINHPDTIPGSTRPSGRSTSSRGPSRRRWKR